MRKSIGVLLAVASLLPMVMMASPAQAATGLTCSKLTGNVTWTPALPKIGNKTLVKSKIVAKGSFSGCTGTPGITSGSFTFTELPSAKGTNCNAFTVKGAAPTFASVVTKWNNGKTTTSAKTTVKVLGLQGTSGIVQTSGKNTSGTVFVGQTATATTLFKPSAGGCVSAALSKATVALKTGTKVVIK
jgi:hypothetical protein